MAPGHLQTAGIVITIGAGLALMASVAQRLSPPTPATPPPRTAVVPIPTASMPVREQKVELKNELPDVHKKLSHLSIRNDDPHLCDKPDDAYYANLGLSFSAGAGSGQPPRFLFNVRHDDDTINWANGFKGDVPVCLIIDEKGNTTNVRFPQSPGTEIEDRIKDRISAWRYKPGYIRFYDNTERAVKCQLAFEFSFR